MSTLKEKGFIRQRGRQEVRKLFSFKNWKEGKAAHVSHTHSGKIYSISISYMQVGILFLFFFFFFLFLFSFPCPIGYIDSQRAMHYFCFIFCVLLIATYACLSESTRQNTISDAQDRGNELEGMSIP